LGGMKKARMIAEIKNNDNKHSDIKRKKLYLTEKNRI
jgi:hypothetical protein